MATNLQAKRWLIPTVTLLLLLFQPVQAGRDVTDNLESQVTHAAHAAHDVISEDQNEIAEEIAEATLEKGNFCTNDQVQEMTSRFQIGVNVGKGCSQQKKWGDWLTYDHHDRDNFRLALYIYPKDDHNGAFNICDGKKFDRYFCDRIMKVSELRSVQIMRTNSVEHATRMLEKIKPWWKLDYVVLGGHGDPTSLSWGPERRGRNDERTPELVVDDPVAEVFLDTLYQKLQPGSSIFLDACQTAGKPPKGVRSNLQQWVAHRLAGHQVAGSTCSFSNDEMTLHDADNFNAQIVLRKQNRLVSTTMDDALRDWVMHGSAECQEKQPLEGIDSLEQCRQYCDGTDSCVAIVWFEHGDGGNPDLKCYLAGACTGKRKVGAQIFIKPGFA